MKKTKNENLFTQDLGNKMIKNKVQRPEISRIIEIKVETAEVRCSKGDCDGDYSPG